MPNARRAAVLVLSLAAAAGVGLGIGYLIWGWPTNWYSQTVEDLPATPENDLVRYGRDLVINTAHHIGKNAAKPENRFAGNNLTCGNCHLNAGLQPFAAPFVSTFATFPMLVDDAVITLKERINGCMRRSLNGNPIPSDSPEMQAFIAYIQYLGRGTPEGVRIPGMGLLPLKEPKQKPDVERGAEVYAKLCANCHMDDGQGQRHSPPRVGYVIPPLWGDDSFNAAAGMAKLDYAAAYVHANMPLGVSYRDPLLGLQQAWDVAAFMIAQPRPPAPPGEASNLR